jgi:hypothetical protein
MKWIKNYVLVFHRPNDVDNIAHYHGITHRDLKRGIIQKQSCEICGCNSTSGHHEYYSNTDYRLRWLCHKHHKIIHALFHNEDKKENALILDNEMRIRYGIHEKD